MLGDAIAVSAWLADWAGRAWMWQDARPLLQLVEIEGEYVADLIERKGTIKHADRFRARLAEHVATVWAYNDAHPVVWTTEVEGKNTTCSRGPKVARWVDGLDGKHKPDHPYPIETIGRVIWPSMEGTKEPIPVAAIDAANRLAELLKTWAGEFATPEDYDEAYERDLERLAPEDAKRVREEDYAAEQRLAGLKEAGLREKILPAADAEDAPAGCAIQGRSKRKLKWLTSAMLLVRDHPDWSDRKIADEVRVNPSTLSRCPEYQQAALLARGGTREELKARFPNGRYNPTTGQIEPIGEDEEPDVDS